MFKDRFKFGSDAPVPYGNIYSIRNNGGVPNSFPHELLVVYVGSPVVLEMLRTRYTSETWGLLSCP